MNASSDQHNTLINQFVRDIIGPAVKSGATYPELLVIFESVQTEMLMILHRHFDIAPARATDLVEASFHQAVERFAADQKGRG